MPKNPEKLSIGFLFDDSLDSNDGVAQQVKILGDYFSHLGHKVVYLCGETRMTSWSGGKVYSLAKNVKVKFNGNKLSIPAFSSSNDINRALIKESLDILHVQMPYSPVMAQRVIGRGYRKIGIVATFHILPSGWMSSVGSYLLGLAQWLSLKKIDQVISVGPMAAEFAKRNFRVNSVIIPNTISLDRFKTKASWTGSSQNIVFLGRLVKRKGCQELIKAYELVAKSHPQSVLTIAGDGPERAKLEKLVDDLDLRNNVKFLGFIKEADKAPLLASANIACFPSLYGESFGVVIIEAMASGSGVVLAGDNPGYRSVLEAQPKLLIDPTNKQMFADRIAELLENKQLFTKLHNWQSAHVKQYDIKVVGQRVLDVYRQVIVNKEQKRHN